jgi:protein arginine N-methyltransferase 5
MAAPADGISIPSSYTAHLAPLSSSKLYNEARAGKDEKKSVETPYVVMFQAVNILSGDGGGTNGRCGPQIQECWEFEHPRRDAALDERTGTVDLSTQSFTQADGLARASAHQ